MTLVISLHLPGNETLLGSSFELLFQKRSRNWPLSSMAGLNCIHCILKAAGRALPPQYTMVGCVSLHRVRLELSKIPIPPTSTPTQLLSPLLPTFPSPPSSPVPWISLFFLQHSRHARSYTLCTGHAHCPECSSSGCYNWCHLFLPVFPFPPGLPTVTVLFAVTT